MRKNRKEVAALLAALLLNFSCPVMARNGSGNDASAPDGWCVFGPGSTRNSNSQITNGEVCVDYTGNIVPGATGSSQMLGTSSYPFNGVKVTYGVDAATAAFSGAATIGGALTVTGAATHSANVYNAKLTRFGNTQFGTGTSLTTGIYVSSRIAPTSTYITVLSTCAGSLFKMTATPTISTNTTCSGANYTTCTGELSGGEYLVLVTTPPSIEITLQDNGTLSGSNLLLFASTATLTNRQSLNFIFNATDSMWHQIGSGPLY